MRRQEWRRSTMNVGRSVGVRAVTRRGLLHPLFAVPVQAVLAGVAVWLGTLALDRLGYELLIQGQIAVATAVMPLPLTLLGIVSEWRQRKRVIRTITAELDEAIPRWGDHTRERPRLARLAHNLER